LKERGCDRIDPTIWPPRLAGASPGSIP
jgi:hypothetical protein